MLSHIGTASDRATPGHWISMVVYLEFSSLSKSLIEDCQFRVFIPNLLLLTYFTLTRSCGAWIQ